MARSMNQTLAWMSAVVLSFVLFGAGFGLFKVMVKSGGGHGESHGASSAISNDHGEEGHAAKDDHAPKDDHADKAEHEGSSEATVKEDHVEKKEDHAEKKVEPTEPASHGEEDGEISADQFKKDGHD